MKLCNGNTGLSGALSPQVCHLLLKYRVCIYVTPLGPPLSYCLLYFYSHYSPSFHNSYPFPFSLSTHLIHWSYTFYLFNICLVGGILWGTNDTHYRNCLSTALTKCTNWCSFLILPIKKKGGRRAKNFGGSIITTIFTIFWATWHYVKIILLTVEQRKKDVRGLV